MLTGQLRQAPFNATASLRAMKFGTAYQGQLVGKEHGLLPKRQGYAIPSHNAREIFDFVQWGDRHRVGIRLLDETGCHIKELNLMKDEGILSDGHYWFDILKHKIGDQRCIHISADLRKEIEEMRRYNAPKGFLFSPKFDDDLRRYFNKFIRPFLSPAWQMRVLEPVMGQREIAYDLQLKGFRANFMTARFSYFFHAYRSMEVAAEMVAAEMHHTTKKTTIRNYLFNAQRLNIDLHAGQRGKIASHDATPQLRIVQFMQK